MSNGGGAMSRDPNVCASCSRLGDGMMEDIVSDAARMMVEVPPAVQSSETPVNAS